MPRTRRKAKYGTGGVTRDGSFWRARWRQNGKRRSQSGFATRELADRFLAGVVGDLALGRARIEPERKRTPTLAVLAEEFFAARGGPRNRNNDDEHRKFKNHVVPELGHYRPDDVTRAHLIAWQAKLLKSGRIRHRNGDPAGLSRAMVKQITAIVSSFYTHLIVAGAATTNPWRLIPREMKRKLDTDYTDYWRNRPWVRKDADRRRIRVTLPEPFNIAHALGDMRGPRPGEIRALDWTQVDLDARLIHIVCQVRNGKLGPPKGGRSRSITISDNLHAILAPWKLKTGGRGLVISPPDGRKRFPFRGGQWIGEKAMNRELRKALVKLGLPKMTWYEATRHTFASHFAREGGELGTLALILGQESTQTTKRYSHHQSHEIRREDTERAQGSADLGPGEVIDLPSAPATVPWAELGPSTKAPKTGGHEKTP